METGPLVQEEIDVVYPIKHVSTSKVSESNSSNALYMFFFNIFEILFVLSILLISLPIFLVVSLLIILESSGPIFYKQSRVGVNGKEFNIYKFRSMYVDAEKFGPQWASKDDNRITVVGNFIRKTRIDELPQLMNILKREMSLIGPRPERAIFIKEFVKEYPEFVFRTSVKPGLTGWAQVNGGYELTPKEKLDKDLYYIENRNIKLDAFILFLTIKVVITGEGAR
ncbi:sugar transferase [Exiguobacterium sp. s28]|uniref:sugar transferase n=1 Tax=Exiguobacterium sp. s28 TaxID=2751238 RepID=UPI003530342A